MQKPLLSDFRNFQNFPYTFYQAQQAQQTGHIYFQFGSVLAWEADMKNYFIPLSAENMADEFISTV